MKKYWSAHVTKHSHAMDLEPGVFRKRSPRAMANSLFRSASQSGRIKRSPRASAISMATFYVNRAGKNLSAERKRTIGQARRILRRK